MRIAMLAALALIAGSAAVAEETSHTITVNGTGFAEIEPDRAIVTMSIISRDRALENAQKKAADVTASVLGMADRMDIDRSDIDTTGASVQPEYRWDRDRQEREFIGYLAQRRISIKLEELDKLGAVIEGAVDAGVNQVMPPVLDSSQRKDAHRKALEAAAKDAEANAAALANALGVKLGKPVNVNSSWQSPRPPIAAARTSMLSAEAAQAETYNAADLRFDAQVTVTFDIE